MHFQLKSVAECFIFTLPDYEDSVRQLIRFSVQEVTGTMPCVRYSFTVQRKLEMLNWHRENGGNFHVTEHAFEHGI